MDVSAAFLDRSCYYLESAYLPKIERCLERLNDEQIWWRPNEQSNSFGNLVLHLAGNLRQYIVSGVGGAPDIRERDREFAARGGVTRDELIATLRAVVREAVVVLRDLSPDVLGEVREIQGKDQVVFNAIYHVVEHFSMHTGQIAYVTKLLTAEDLGFYEFLGGTFRLTYGSE